MSLYTSQDLRILDEMILDDAKIPLTGHHKKNQLVLSEEDGTSYTVTITGVPEETIAIKVDCFPAPKSIFKEKVKGICKRADFVLVNDQDAQKFMVFIELKAGKANNTGITQQLKGADAFMTYCQKIGQSFWSYPNFLTNYEYRFISIKEIKISKRPTVRKKRSNIHSDPSDPLRISSLCDIPFKKLICQPS